jgi:uncharacterized protein (DUF2252 family)
MARPPAPDSRAQILNARRELKMARSAHAYVRGSTDRFYRWIETQTSARLPSGPPVWICGDCHVGNLGPIGHRAGSTVIELRDLDQTVIGNPAHDVLRLALSLAMSARSSDLPGVTTARLTEDLVAGYEQSFVGEVSEDIDALPAPIRLVMKRAVKRTWRHVFDERLGRQRLRRRRRQIPLGSRFWPLDDKERAAIRDTVELDSVRHLVTHLEERDDNAKIEFVDAAFWVKGCSSLGLWRAAVLVDIVETKKRGERRTPSLLDFKQAVVASSPWAPGYDPDLAPAQRVVAGARKLAPALGDRMVATDLLDRSVYIRELLPQDLKVELDHLSVEDGRAVAYYLGMVVGRAHGRQMPAADRERWRVEMATHRSKNLDAPGWLWQALVELVAVHEHAYLEHCRRHALATHKFPEIIEAVPPEVLPIVVNATDSPAMQSVESAADAPPDDEIVSRDPALQ